MKVREIIVDEGILSTIGSKLLGKAASKGAKALAPQAAKQAANAAKVAQFKGDIALVGGVLGNWFKIIKNVALAWGILQPIVMTAKEIMSLNQKLKNNEISPADYESEVQYWLGKCVTQIIAVGFAKFSVNTAGRLIGTLPFGSTAGALVSKLSGPAAAAFGVYLTTPDGARAFAQWFAGKSFAPLVAEFMRDWVGSWAKKGYDTLIGHEDARTPAAGSNGDSSETDAISSIPQVQGNPHGMKFDFATGNVIN